MTTEQTYCFPKEERKVVKGDATKEEIARVTQLKGGFVQYRRKRARQSTPNEADEMKSFNAHYTLRAARNNKKCLVFGKRWQQKAKKDDE